MGENLECGSFNVRLRGDILNGKSEGIPFAPKLLEVDQREIVADTGGTRRRTRRETGNRDVVHASIVSCLQSIPRVSQGASQAGLDRRPSCPAS